MSGEPFVTLRNVYTPHGFVAEIRTGRPGVPTEVVATVNCRHTPRGWTLTMPDGERVGPLTAEEATDRMTDVAMRYARQFFAYDWSSGDAEEA